MKSAGEILVEVQDLRKHFEVQSAWSRRRGVVRAVDGVNLAIRRGETLGLVGESGCGKSTTGRLILRLLEPSGGRIFFQGQDVTAVRGSKLRALRRHMQIVFQDPYSSLNPRMTAGEIIAEPMRIFGLGSPAEINRRVDELLHLVGLGSYHALRYPHEFSGGQRQRIGIARALALSPALVVCDEPVSALDVSIQSQIINLLKDLQQQLGLTYLFIAHGLNVVKHMSDRVGVMYLGRLVELAGAEELYSRPLHPYTRALLSAIPIPDPGRQKERIILPGDIPSPLNPPPGCLFHTRCPEATARCSQEVPAWREVSPEHFAACHLL
ncbi:MAG: ABC transporter ATP-binding protein [Desulfurispora sp.]|uniref:ABC transporter ATP-binding protein n=1 Tax=Desulfurispora sp. TaxID=3014275 RepID=UPI0040490074